MPKRIEELLTLAITRNVGIVLSLPSCGMLRHHKSRFLGRAGTGFLVESVPSEQLLIDTLVGGNQPVGISFKAGHTKVMFASPIVEYRPEHAINAEVTVNALALPMPEDVKVIQRRSNYRVRVNPNDGILLRLWRIGAQAQLSDRPQSSQEVPAEVRDLSVGGIGVLLRGTGAEAPRIFEEDRLRLQLELKGHTLLLEGRMRTPHATPRSNQILTGIRFGEMQADLEGRRTLALLTRLVGELQREEIRRIRLGLIT